MPSVNSKPSSLRSELNRIGKKVEKNLFDLALVADEVAKPLIDCNVEIDAVLCSSLSHKRTRVVYR